VPEPLHEPVGWNDDAEVQNAPAHCVPLPGCAQAPPLHRPVLPQMLSVGFEQRPCGSAVLSLTALHVPGLPGRLHASQVLHEPLLQQTPSTQLLVVHSLPRPHDAPGDFFSRQMPPVPVQ
jgi:hypothetical protein